MSATNHILIITGRLGRDPEMRYTASGQPVTTLSVATTRTYRNNQEEKVDETTWFRVSVWGKQAEHCNQYLKKGALVQVQGRLVPDGNGNPRIWNKQDGTPGASFEVHANNVDFLSGGNGGGAPAASSDEEGDVIPF